MEASVKKRNSFDYCQLCRRFLSQEDETYSGHLEEHCRVQDVLFGDRWHHFCGMGDCRYIVRNGSLYEYDGASGYWFSEDLNAPAIKHSEYL